MDDINSQDVASLLRDSQRKDRSSRQPRLKLVLFDIDGTLLSSGTFTKCLSKVIGEVLGPSINIESLSDRVKTGRTVRSELILITNEAGIPQGMQEELIEEILASATKEYKLELSKSPLKLLDGVEELIGNLSRREDIVLGIVTNNIREMMMLKLDNVNLLEIFSRSGLMFPGDSTGHKNDLLKLAVDNAVAKFGSRLDRKDIFYIGDQVSDVEGAKSAGAVAVGVATGRSSFEELVAAGAAAVFRSFADNTKAAMTVIDRPRHTTGKKMTV
ncbi:MAG: HAD family hydrolase [Candidatus Micrarchaeaceae archaeon]